MRSYNNRLDRRFKVNVPVAVNYLDGRRIRWATNLSSGGMQLRRGIEDVMEGDAVDLQFDLPEKLGRIDCIATIVYDRDGFLGLRFDDLPLHQQFAMDRYVTRRTEQRWIT